ncbi:MAG: ADP-glyceromanno-heptose 6-epimerase [Bacteroidota bacterium]|nr:ADP-glyceromanno-heptose 6-epimerase [Candidatus Kapabacteria bacterium]MDW8220639.1 ADP-glyceromanno-heptose 6-epimerase [Bacteroidota bacterium]
MIVVTGGAGFIGSCLVRKLNNQGIHDILIVDSLGTGIKWKNLVGKVYQDIVDKTTFRRELLAGTYGAEIEAIFHLGACSSTTETNADYLLDNNYRYSRDLAEYTEARNIRFIYASSAATYGAGEQGYSDSVFTLQPLNMYGYSKHMFDEWVLRNGFDTKFVGVKFFNVFGPNEYHKGDMASVVMKAFRQVWSTGTIRLFRSYNPAYADGEQKRDFIYVKDVVDVLYEMLVYGEVRGIYNLGSGLARSWNDVARAVFAAMQRPVSVEYIEMPLHLRSQYQYFTQADMSKLQQTRIVCPNTTLEDAIQDYICQYLMNDFAHY